jgi:phosphonopyruvate decarboxylase
MGLANHVALGIHMHISERVVMVDGDGAILMHMGSMTAIGKWGTDSLVHIVINNGCHESVGAQPTLGFDIDLCAIARACGYTNVYCIREEHELMHWLQNGYQTIEKQFVEIKVNAESRSSLSRPTNTPAERKDELMKAIQTK